MASHGLRSLQRDCGRSDGSADVSQENLDARLVCWHTKAELHGSGVIGDAIGWFPVDQRGNLGVTDRHAVKVSDADDQFDLVTRAVVVAVFLDCDNVRVSGVAKLAEELVASAVLVGHDDLDLDVVTLSESAPNL